MAYIGSEFACILNALGCEVTQIIRSDLILRGFDDDLREEIQNAMKEHGVNLMTHSEIRSISKTENGVDVTVMTQHGEEHVFADAVSLAATGRKPNVKSLGLDNTGVEMDRDAIAVDEHSCTTVPNIFAVGDVTERINLTPRSHQRGTHFCRHLLWQQARTHEP